MKKIAILQSNYIPWKGYFDIVNKVDLFIFHDDLQYTKNDWRNRNKIKTPNGLDWITIPCGTSEHRLICEVEIKDNKWQKQHWARLEQSYKKAKFFNEYREYFKEIYLGNEWKNLSDFNQVLIKRISKDIFDIKTTFEDSRKYNLTLKKAERVLELIKKVEGTHYLSGPSAKNYLTEDLFTKENIELEWMDYSGYKEYEQLNPPFEHGVTILDLIFNEGPNARNFMKSFKQEKGKNE